MVVFSLTLEIQNIVFVFDWRYIIKYSLLITFRKRHGNWKSKGSAWRLWINTIYICYFRIPVPLVNNLIFFRTIMAYKINWLCCCNTMKLIPKYDNFVRNNILFKPHVPLRQNCKITCANIRSRYLRRLTIESKLKHGKHCGNLAIWRILYTVLWSTENALCIP